MCYDSSNFKKVYAKALKRNSSRKRKIREPSVGARWLEADGELALELPAEGLYGLCKFGRISRRRKGKGMLVPVRARDFPVKQGGIAHNASLRNVLAFRRGVFLCVGSHKEHSRLQRHASLAASRVNHFSCPVAQGCARK